MEPRCDHAMGRVRAQSTVDMRRNMDPWCHLYAGSAQGSAKKRFVLHHATALQGVLWRKKRGRSKKDRPSIFAATRGPPLLRRRGAVAQVGTRCFPRSLLGLLLPSDNDSPHWSGSGGVERGESGASFPVPTAHGNSTAQRGHCTGESGKCCPVLNRSPLSVSDWTLSLR